ncbi:hypothetical protein J4558_10025 [Leptolyngbya sp. 15MV]|nr:hypothetical protein J4558_10025 [Leptolyngbya sp. 15MV]
MIKLDVADVDLANLTPEDWTAAGQLADLLGIPVDEFVQEFLEEWNRLTPEQRAEFEQAVDRANEVLPDLDASLDRIEQGISNCALKLRETHAQVSAMSKRVSSIEATLGIGPG